MVRDDRTSTARAPSTGPDAPTCKGIITTRGDLRRQHAAPDFKPQTEVEA